jgi:hypothetical protein
MKLFVQLYNDKFIESLCLVKNTEYNILSGSINKDIYKINYELKCTHYIFVDKLIDNEINQFIQDYNRQTKIYIYHSDKPNNNLIQNFNQNVIHLTKEYVDGATKLPLMCRERIPRSSQENRDNTICVFLDNCSSIPKELIDQLYPNSKLPIRMFNHASLKHFQNLGFISEQEKIKVLEQSEFCVVINHKDYILEAHMCGCKPILALDLPNIKNQSYNLLQAEQETTYEKFLTELQKK